ncbi:MAG: hypothetical protein WED11_00030, partial [Natronospirillum sp.]
LLLTATPEQDGSHSHFARLQLLDPARFHDYDTYLAQENTLQQLSADLGTFIDQGAQSTTLDAWCQDPYSQTLLTTVKSEASETATQHLVDYLIDIHGTSRLQFRNTRDRIQGFPERRLTAHPLQCPLDYAVEEPYPELNTPAWTETDPRVAWLTDLIR